MSCSPFPLRMGSLSPRILWWGWGGLGARGSSQQLVWHPFPSTRLLKSEHRQVVLYSGFTFPINSPPFFFPFPKPFVNNEQGILPVLGHELADGAVTPGNLELYQQIREPDVLHCIKPPCGSHAQSAGEVGFAAAGGTQQDDVVVLLDVVAGAEPQQFLLFQTSVGQILHIL